MNRLKTLENSLAKKNAKFDEYLNQHFADVKAANGQPLNDKRGGAATLARWENQNQQMRELQASIEKTKHAIEREKNKIARVENCDIPEFLMVMVENGELTQWRKHPETFFVPGVDRARLHWDKKKNQLGYKYLSDVPPDQRETFKSTANKALKLSREY